MAYKITYNLNGGILQTNIINPTLNQTNLPNPLPWCLKEGHKFIQWVDASTAKPVNAGQTLTSDITLNAIFQQQYQISQPVLNPVISFDATTTNQLTLTFALLGIPKKAVTKALINIVDVTTTIPANINLGDGIFDITYSSDSISEYVNIGLITINNIGGTTSNTLFTNNHKYNISIALINFNNTIMSDYSQYVFFECYKTPKLDIYLDVNYQQVFTNNTIIGTSSFSIFPKFNTQDSESIASLGQMQFTLRTTSGNTIEKTQWLTSDTSSLIFSNLNPDSYILSWSFYTSDRMLVDNNTINFTITYNQSALENSQLVATNNACGGYITITSNISDADLAKISTMVLARKSLDNIPVTPTSEIKLMTISSNKNFTMIDPYNQANVNYQYILYPYDINGNIMEPITTQVFSCFKNAFICDTYTSFMLVNGLSYSTYNTKNITGLYEPYGANYPTVVTNSSLKYNSGEIKVTSLSRSTTLNTYNSQVSYYDEVRNRIELNTFLTNKRPKILKDTLGNIWVVFITNDISNAFNASMFNAISDTTYSWVEISDLSQKGLDKLGMLGRFGLTYVDGTKNSYADITTIGNTNNIHM